MPPFSWDSSTPPCPGPGRAEQRWSWWCPRKNKALCWLCSSCSRGVSAVPASRTSGCCSLLPSSLLCSLPAWGGFQEHSHRPMGEDPCICKPGPAPGMCSSPTASRVWDRVMLSALRVQAAELPAFLTPQCWFEAIQPRWTPRYPHAGEGSHPYPSRTEGTPKPHTGPAGTPITPQPLSPGPGVFLIKPLPGMKWVGTGSFSSQASRSLGPTAPEAGRALVEFWCPQPMGQSCIIPMWDPGYGLNIISDQS